MHFFYPNFINDFWRIMGILFFEDRNHFVSVAGEKRFDEASIRSFAAEQGIAFFDTARRIRRLKAMPCLRCPPRSNRVDKHCCPSQPHHLRVIASSPQVVWPGKCFAKHFMPSVSRPSVLLCSALLRHTLRRDIEFWRMPSSSRAYPLALDKG